MVEDLPFEEGDRDRVSRVALIDAGHPWEIRRVIRLVNGQRERQFPSAVRLGDSDRNWRGLPREDRRPCLVE